MAKSEKGKAQKQDDGWGAGAPASKDFDAERWDKGEDLGELIAFVGIDSADVDTEHGPTTAAECDYIVILTGDNKNKVYHDQLVFGAALSRAIYGAETPSGIVLGRLSQGEKKKGKNKPWLLDDPKKKDHERQVKWFNKNAKRKKSGKIVIKEPKF